MAKQQLKLPTLLVITDNPSIRFWVKKHLDDQFFIINASKESEALSALNAYLDFIIVDSAIEDCNVFELCKKLNAQTRTAFTPILLITGRLNKAYRNQALEAGVTDFLNNELDMEELETRIATGRNAAALRQKTEELSASIPKPKDHLPTAYLKSKFLLNDQALRLIATAKKDNIPVALLFVQIDGFAEMVAHFGA